MNELLPVSVNTEHNIFNFYTFIIWIFEYRYRISEMLVDKRWQVRINT